MIRKLIVPIAFLLIIGLCCSCSGEQAPGETEETSPIVYSTIVSMGDSITAGFGLKDAKSSCFTTLLREEISQNTNRIWKSENDGVSGDDTTDLLQRLLTSKKYAQGLPEADLITLCIGANNILGPYTRFLSVYLSNANDNEILETFKVFNQAVQEGIDTYETDFEQIMSLIRQKNPDAPILLLNIYNPYDGSDNVLTIMGLQHKVASMAESLIMQLNEKVSQMAERYDLILVDVHAAFEGHGPDYINGAYQASNPLMYDPHPNVEGHAAIAKALLEAWENQNF